MKTVTKSYIPQGSIRTTLFLSLGVGYILVFLAFPVYPQNSRNSVSGFVFSPERLPVGEVAVEILNDLDQVVQRTRTGSNGRFAFSGLQSGRFRLRVLPLGTPFEEQAVDVELISMGPAGRSSAASEQRDIYLRSARSAGQERMITGTVFVQEVPEQAKRMFELANSHFAESRADEGIQSLLDALETFPEYFVALERLGLEYLKRQNWNYARAVYTKAVSVNDRSFWSWYGLSVSAREQREFGIATEAANKAIDLDRNSADATLALGIALRLSKNYSKAESILLQANKLSGGKSADVRWNLALLYGNDLKRYKEAADELEIYLKLTPDNANASNVKKIIESFRQKAGKT